MANYEFLILDQQSDILIITIHRPEKLNALNAATIGEIKSAMVYAVENDSVKGIIITGSGEKAFVAGADISEITGLNSQQARDFAAIGQKAFSYIENSPKPTIAAVNGYALGGGCELAMACHCRISSSNAIFGQPEVNLGLIPGYGGTQRLTRLIGRGKALELLMSGKSIAAQEALNFGLVNMVVDNPRELISTTTTFLKKILSKAPLAIRYIIDSVNSTLESPETGYEKELDNFSACCQTEDFKEGTAAFLEKRPPVFKGK